MSKSKSTKALTMSKHTHSSYWLDRDLFVDDVDTLDSKDSIIAEGPNLMKMVRLAAIRRAVSNFVQILVGKQIPVQYSSGKDSYTDGQTIVISADENPDTFDPTVGLALHEASHVLLSDFTFLKTLTKFQNSEVPYAVPAGNYGMTQRWEVLDKERKMFVTRDTNVLSKMLLPELFAQLPIAGEDMYAPRVNKMLNDLKVLMNILEDRRIDKYVYTNAAGYRPYYDALYAKYFYTEDQANNLRYNPEWRDLTVDNYVNRLLLAFHPAADPNALPGLKELIALMDIKSIERVGHVPSMMMNGAETPLYYNSVKYEDMPQLWKDACVLYAHILTFVKDGQDTSNQQKETATGDAIEEGEGGEGEGEGDGEAGEGEASDMPNMDMGKMVPTPVEAGPKGKAGKFSATKANKELDAMKKIMNNEAKKKKITAAEASTIASMEQAAAEIVDITGDGVPFGHCMVTRKLTDSIVNADWFIFGRAYGWGNANATAIAAGRRMGAILEHRLQVRNDPMFTKQTRLPQGGLDRRLLAQLGMDITSVFQKSRVDQHRPAMLHLTIDASGSMSGNKWSRCITVAVALAYVGSKIRNIDTVVSIRGGQDMPMVAILFDSRRDQFPTFIKNMTKVMPAGATPEGLCFKATMDLVLESANTHDVYFINFSDGEPAFDYTRRKAMDKSGVNQYFSYGGELAITHTRKMVKMIKDRGVKVLSYFISEDGNYYADITFERFRKMYGEDAVKVNISNATEVVRTVNKLLLSRGA
jgi:hypothetical protein